MKESKKVSMDMDRSEIDPNDLYYRLKLPKKIDGCNTIYEIAIKGCPKCGMRFNVEASIMFGSLHCPDHGNIWHWIAGRRDKTGYVSQAWKNHFTGESSKEWKKRFPEGR